MTFDWQHGLFGDAIKNRRDDHSAFPLERLRDLPSNLLNRILAPVAVFREADGEGNEPGFKINEFHKSGGASTVLASPSDRPLSSRARDIKGAAVYHCLKFFIAEPFRADIVWVNGRLIRAAHLQFERGSYHRQSACWCHSSFVTSQ